MPIKFLEKSSINCLNNTHFHTLKGDEPEAETGMRGGQFIFNRLNDRMFQRK